MKRRYIVASTGTILLQEYQPISCAWKTVVFLKGGHREKEAIAWVGTKAEAKNYQVINTHTGAIAATAQSEEEATKQKRSLTRALPRTDAGKGIFQIRIV
jgi:hypothetical protein